MKGGRKLESFKSLEGSINPFSSQLWAGIGECSQTSYYGETGVGEVSVTSTLVDGVWLQVTVLVPGARCSWGEVSV